MMPQVSLGELIRIHYGKALKKGERVESGGWDVFGSSGIVGKHNQALTDSPTIIIGRKGSVGAITYAPNGAWTIDTAFFTETFEPSRLDLRYLYYALIQARLDKYTITTSIPGINRENIYSTKIPLPPLSEQKRIASILDKADAVRKKRKKAIELTGTFLRSAFLEMFGDPVTNPKGWEVQKLVDLCVPKVGLKAGPFGSALKKESYTNFGFRIYGQEQVIAGTLSVGNYYISDEKFNKLSSCAVEPGDLLISLVGSIGNTLVVPDKFEPGIINPRLIRIRTNKDLLAPLHLQWVLKQDSLQNVLGRRSHGGTMPVLNASMLKELRIPVPPLAFQEEFLALLTKADSSFTTAESLDEKAEDLFNSLVQRAFRGEL